jgi:hypothetical protein
MRERPGLSTDGAGNFPSEPAERWANDNRGGAMMNAMLAMLAMNGAGASILWIIAVVLVIAGIVSIVRGSVIAGIVLIIVGCLVGPGGVSIFK